MANVYARFHEDAPGKDGSRNVYAQFHDEDSMSQLEAGAAGAVQGASFGFADEAAGLVNPEWKTGIRDWEKRAQKDRPWSYGAGEVGGGLATALVPEIGVAGKIAEATKGAGAATKALSIAGLGAGYGGLDAFGSAEGDLGQRAKAVPGGMAAGALTGGLVHGAGKLAAGAGDLIKSALPGAQDAEVKAGRLLRRALGDDDLTVRDLSIEQKKLATGKRQIESAPEIAASARRKRRAGYTNTGGGQNIQGLAEAVATVPGNARTSALKFSTDRDATRADRMADSIRDFTNATPGDKSYGAYLDDLDAQRKLDAKPAYEQAYGHDIAPDAYTRTIAPQIYPMLAAHPDLIKDTLRVAILDGEAKIDPQTMGVDQSLFYDKNGKLRQLTVQGLDMLKRAAADKVSALYRAGSSREGRALSDRHDQLVDALDKATGGDYGKAIGQYSGSKRMEELVKQGRDFFKMDHWEIAKILDGRGPRKALSKDEIDGFMFGAARGLEDASENGQLPMVRKFMQKEKVQKQVARAFGVSDAEADAILDGKAPKNFSPEGRRFAQYYTDMLRELRGKEYTNERLKGSPTARRQAAIEGATTDAEDPLANLLGAVTQQGTLSRIPTSAPELVGHFLGEPVTNAANDYYRYLRYPGIKNPAVNKLLGDLLWANGKPATLAAMQAAIDKADAGAPDIISRSIRRRFGLGLAAGGGSLGGLNSSSNVQDASDDELLQAIGAR